MRRATLASLVVLALSAEARAQSVAADREDPRHVVTPTFEVAGKTTGEGTVGIGVDLLLPFANKVNELHAKLTFEAASHDGFSTILRGGSGGFDTESSVAGALHLTYTTLQSAPGIEKRPPDAMALPERRALLRECMKRDDWKPARYKNEEFDINNDEHVDELDARAYCSDARSKLREAENAKKLPLPRRQLAFAFAVGRSAFKQLSPTADPMVFHVTSSHRPRFSAALGYAAFAPVERLSFEATGTFGSSYEPSSRKARWCGPVGSVTRPDGSAMDPAESCSELPLGDPSRTTTTAASAGVGFVGDDSNWRVALGPTAKLGFGGKNVAYDIGLELPFYLVRSSAEFSGIVRVAPALLWTRDADGAHDTKVLLTLTLLGNRTLFNTSIQ